MMMHSAKQVFTDVGLTKLNDYQEYIDPRLESNDWEMFVDPVEKNGIPMEIFTFPFTTEAFCSELIDAAETYGKWTKKRHKDYPTHDMLIAKFGWFSIYDKMLTDYAIEIANQYWQTTIRKVDNSETFIVKYDTSEDGQTYLPCHNDTSTFTTSVALNESYEGGGTYYPRHNIFVKTKTGSAIVHPGLVHRHGGRPVTSGIRYVLITFHRARGW